MERLRAEFYTIDPATKLRHKVFQWAVPESLSLDAAKDAAKQRALDAGYKVTAANFRRGVDNGEVAAIVIYMEKK